MRGHPQHQLKWAKLEWSRSNGEDGFELTLAIAPLSQSATGSTGAALAAGRRRLQEAIDAGLGPRFSDALYQAIQSVPCCCSIARACVGGRQAAGSRAAAGGGRRTDRGRLGRINFIDPRNGGGMNWFFVIPSYKKQRMNEQSGQPLARLSDPTHDG